MSPHWELPEFLRSKANLFAGAMKGCIVMHSADAFRHSTAVSATVWTYAPTHGDGRHTWYP